MSTYKVVAVSMLALLGCSAPVVMKTVDGKEPYNPNRCYRLFEPGAYRVSCLKQFPTGDAYPVQDTQQVVLTN